MEAEIGIFGGSGFYRFLDNVKEYKIETPYGPPSDKIAIADFKGKRIAFLPRHGKEHTIPPHMINYRANVYAMSKLGVNRIFGPCAAGSLQAHVRRGSFVICDQFVDRTWGRGDTFYDGPITTHISAADPYCPEMRKLVINKCKELGFSLHEQGTVVVIQGPRFSTRSESRWFTKMGWEVINMTQYPETILARELGICYVNISLITDYDVGLEGEEFINPVSHEEVFKVFNENNDRLRTLLYAAIEAITSRRNCSCEESLLTARF
ncbi:MAG: Purine nucleoside phosphorylase [Desulfotomaculum sp. 46_296]|nr:MAG: Purine nucleoside phosphorylase [Desulfotomaculum sp. 46_296]HAU31578.1 S-methyl-5'-thioadenosine phosphorylase [Desulfotomaculum sp.]